MYHPRYHVSFRAIGAQPVLAIRRKRSRAGAIYGGVEGVGNDWPDGPTLLNGLAFDHAIVGIGDIAFGIIETQIETTRGDQAFDLRIAVHGLCLKIPPEGCFRIEVEDRHEVFAAVIHKDRLIVRNELREERNPEQHNEDPKRPVCPSVTAKVAPAALVQRRHDAAWCLRHRGRRIMSRCFLRQRIGFGQVAHLTPPAFQSRYVDRQGHT